MSYDNWKQRIYDSYVSYGFGSTQDAKKYERHRKYFKKNHLRFMPRNKDAKLLELGCGMGEFCYFCKKEGYIDYEGIDASAENIAYIKEYMGAESKVSVDNMFEYLSDDKTRGYDAIILNDVIEHLAKPEIFRMLDLVYANLNQNGVFLIKTPNMANPFVSTAGQYIDITHEIGFTECSMRQVLLATGFDNIKIVGLDIYVLNPIISIVAKLVSKLLNLFWRLLSALYGRGYLKIFEKDLLAVAYRRN